MLRILLAFRDLKTHPPNVFVCCITRQEGQPIQRSPSISSSASQDTGMPSASDDESDMGDTIVGHLPSASSLAAISPMPQLQGLKSEQQTVKGTATSEIDLVRDSMETNEVYKELTENLEPVRDKFAEITVSHSGIVLACSKQQIVSCVQAEVTSKHYVAFNKEILCPQLIYVTLDNDSNAGICKDIVFTLVYCNSLPRVVVSSVDGGVRQTCGLWIVNLQASSAPYNSGQECFLKLPSNTPIMALDLWNAPSHLKIS